MIKEAKTIYPVHPLIKDRWSARAFSDRPITKEEALTLIEAASWAPSSMNEQPWEYYYAFKGSDGFHQMWECLSTGNRLWADKAPLLILCVANKNFHANGAPNHHYMHDTGLANANLLTQAISMGIHAHVLAGYDIEKTHALFGLRDDQETVCFMALGFLGDPEQLEEPFKTRELTGRNRKSLDTISKEMK